MGGVVGLVLFFFGLVLFFFFELVSLSWYFNLYHWCTSVNHSA